MDPISGLTATNEVVAAVVGLSSFAVFAGRAMRKNYNAINAVLDELRPNGGSSLRDAINRIESFQISALTLTGKAYWISDPDGKCSYASPQLATMQGVHPEQVLGWGWVSQIAPQDREQVRLRWDSAVKDQREFHESYRFIWPDGTLLPVRGHAIPIIHAQSKKVMGMIGWAEREVPHE